MSDFKITKQVVIAKSRKLAANWTMNTEILDFETWFKKPRFSILGVLDTGNTLIHVTNEVFAWVKETFIKDVDYFYSYDRTNYLNVTEEVLMMIRLKWA